MLTAGWQRYDFIWKYCDWPEKGFGRAGRGLSRRDGSGYGYGHGTDMEYGCCLRVLIRVIDDYHIISQNSKSGRYCVSGVLSYRPSNPRFVIGSSKGENRGQTEINRVHRPTDLLFSVLSPRHSPHNHKQEGAGQRANANTYANIVYRSQHPIQLSLTWSSQSLGQSLGRFILLHRNTSSVLLTNSFSSQSLLFLSDLTFSLQRIIISL